MYQAYDRPKTPTRFHTGQQHKPIETSPFKEGKPNTRYANPSMLSNDVFYEKHYDDPAKQLTPAHKPLGIQSKGYGKMVDYKDRYKQISGQADAGISTPTRSNHPSTRDQLRSDLRDNYNQRSKDSGAHTPTRNQQAASNLRGHHQHESGARTPNRRGEPQLADLKASGERTPSDYNRTRNH